MAQAGIPGPRPVVLSCAFLGSLSTIIPSIKEAIGLGDPNVTIEMTPFTEQLAASLIQERCWPRCPASSEDSRCCWPPLGLYGVLSYNVAPTPQ